MRKTVFWILGIALLARGIIALFQIRYGINDALNIDQQLYGPFNAGLEIYHDYYFYYVRQLAELASGVMPYKGIAYSYPPLFLYTLYPFYILAGQYAAAIPILLADAATSPLIYLIVRKFANERTSLIAGMAYALSPLALFYEGYLWFSSQPMTFFIVLCMYFYIEKKPIYAVTALAIAVMFKQEAIFVLPAFAIWYVKDFRKESYKGFAVFAGVVLLVSLPFLIVAPGPYLAALSYQTLVHYAIPIVGQASNQTGVATSAVNTTHSLVCSSISNNTRSLICNYGNFTYTDVKSVPPWTVIFSYGFINQVSQWIMIPLFAIVPYFLFKLRRNNSTAFLASAYSIIILNAVFGFSIHPIYRYYLIPAYALLLAASTKRSAVVVSIAAPILSLFLPSGTVQILPPLFSVLVILTTDYWTHARTTAGILPVKPNGKLQPSWQE